MNKTLSNIATIAKQEREETEIFVPSNKFTSSPLACIEVISLFSSVIVGPVPVPVSAIVFCVPSSLTLKTGVEAFVVPAESCPKPVYNVVLSF